MKTYRVRLLFAYNIQQGKLDQRICAGTQAHLLGLRLPPFVADEVCRPRLESLAAYVRPKTSSSDVRAFLSNENHPDNKHAEKRQHLEKLFANHECLMFFGDGEQHRDDH